MLMSPPSMQHPLSQALKIVLNAETIVPFLVGSVFLAVFGGVVYDIFKHLLGDTIPGLIRIGAIALLILVIAVAIVAWVISKRLSGLSDHVPFEIQQKALDCKYRGLILLVSNSEACQTAIQFHQPTLKRCWLICSPKTLPEAERLQQQFSECLDQPIVINDVYDPLKFRNCVSMIYRTRLPQGWQESDVIADYTGMTVHASVGMVLACAERGRSLQYTPARFDEQRKELGSLNPIRISLNR
jgi:hypothetical protein